MKQKFKVEGMTCASCKAHVENAVKKLEIKECNVNLLKNSMEVLYDESKITSDDIIKQVINAGYNSYIYDESFVEDLNKKTNNKLIKLIISIVLLVILMYFSMYKMFNFPIPQFLKLNASIINVYFQFVLASIIIILNYNFYKNGLFRILKRSPNMDSLIFVGSFSSYLYATINLILLTINVVNNNMNEAINLSNNLYFETSAMILTLVSVGKYLENLSKKQTTKAIDELIGMIPKKVLRIKDEKEEMVELKEIEVNDLIKLKPFDFVAIDGKIISGNSNFDESSITGESILVNKSIGDDILSGSINQQGSVIYEATKKSNESTISKVIEMVNDASSSKMNVERIADSISSFFVPIIFSLSIICFIIWILITKDFKFSFNIGISILVISCPCALGLATPLCVMVSSGMSAKRHILIKSAETFEKLDKIDTILIDKTGTITKGLMEITDKIEYKKDALGILGALEKLSNHPLSYKISELDNGFKISDFKNEVGLGINGIYNNERYYVGGYAYLENKSIKINDDFLKLISDEKNVVAIFKDEILGIVALKDEIKEDSKKAIELFKKHKIDVIMASGDIEKNAISIANEVGIQKVYGKCLPIDKANIIDELQKNGKKVLMIGDGINDAVALSKAYVSIAVDSKMDIATNSADIVLSKPSLIETYNAYKLAKKTVNNIKLNLFWALLYNVIAIPIAAGVFYFAFNLLLSPMLGALCMSLSSVCVCLNALRLKKIKWEEYKMELKFIVSDMMCEKCVSHIKEALNVEGVNGVDINLKKHIVCVDTVLTKEEISNKIINAGYTPKEK